MESPRARPVCCFSRAPAGLGMKVSSWRRASSSNRARRWAPTARAFSCSPSSRMASSTAIPTRQLTGLPPAEEKNVPSSASDSAMARVVITAPTGKPLPMGLAAVMMSGTTPCSWNAQKCSPQRP